MQIIAKSVIFEHLSFRKGSEVHFFDAGVSQTCFCKADKIPPYITPKNKLMDKSPLCTCLIKQDLEELLGCKVDIVRLRDKMDSFLREKILKEGIYV